jgi:hypothetical protein
MFILFGNDFGKIFKPEQFASNFKTTAWFTLFGQSKTFWLIKSIVTNQRH